MPALSWVKGKSQLGRLGECFNCFRSRPGPDKTIIRWPFQPSRPSQLD